MVEVVISSVLQRRGQGARWGEGLVSLVMGSQGEWVEEDLRMCSKLATPRTPT